jgi:hypothetical protein
MYESLTELCRIAGDGERETLALKIQEQERATAGFQTSSQNLHGIPAV